MYYVTFEQRAFYTTKCFIHLTLIVNRSINLYEFRPVLPLLILAYFIEANSIGHAVDSSFDDMNS